MKEKEPHPVLLANQDKEKLGTYFKNVAAIEYLLAKQKRFLVSLTPIQKSRIENFPSYKVLEKRGL